MKRTLLVWTLEVDAPATAAAYSLVAQGAAQRCGCQSCRNFDAARPAFFPNELQLLLEDLRVDPSKETMVRRVARLEGDRHLYAGSYGLCGTLLAGRPSRGFPLAGEEVDVFERVGEDAHVALSPWIRPPTPWPAGGCVRVEFLVALPWILEDPGDVTS